MSDFNAYGDTAPNYKSVLKEGSGNEAVQFANLRLRNRTLFIIFMLFLFPPVSFICIIFFRQYYWSRSDQGLVKLGFWRKILLIAACLAVLSIMPFYLGLMAGFYESFWPAVQEGFQRAHSVDGGASHTTGRTVGHVSSNTQKKDVLGVTTGMSVSAALQIVQQQGMRCIKGDMMDSGQYICDFIAEDAKPNDQRRNFRLYFNDPTTCDGCPRGQPQLVLGIRYLFYTYRPEGIFNDIEGSYQVKLQPLSPDQTLPFGNYNAAFSTGEEIGLTLNKMADYGTSSSALGILDISGLPYDIRDRPAINEPQL